MKDEDLRNSMKSKNLQLVILRKYGLSDTDLDDLREDLSIALLELESVSNDNKELSVKISKIDEEKNKYELEVKSLKQQLKRFEEGSAFEIDIISGKFKNYFTQYISFILFIFFVLFQYTNTIYSYEFCRV